MGTSCTSCRICILLRESHARDQSRAEGTARGTGTPVGTHIDIVYIYGPTATPVEQIGISTGTPDWYVQDKIGSTLALLDTTGSTVATYTYDPYGNTTNTSGTPGLTNLRWQGQYQDPTTGLYYMRARWYDPGSGQFLDTDPLLAATHQPYSYAGDDPINSADPTGLMHCPFLAGCSFSAASKRTPGWWGRLSPCQQSDYIDWQRERNTVYQSMAANQAAEDALLAAQDNTPGWQRALEGASNFGAGILNFTVSTVTLGNASYSAPYSGPGLGASYQIGEAPAWPRSVSRPAGTQRRFAHRTW